MKAAVSLRVLRLALTLACVMLAASWRSTAIENPYGSIVERNPFGLKPPPEPPSAAEQAAPITPPAKVTLTGLVTMFGEPKALFEIVENEGGKPGTPKKPILRQGERMGSVEVLSINIEKNQVRIRNGPVETNITFEIAKSPATNPIPALAGQTGIRFPPPVAGGIAPQPYVNPTIPNPNLQGGNQGSVTLLGGGPPTPQPGLPNPNPGVPTGMGNPPTPANIQQAMGIQPSSGTAVFGGPTMTPPATTPGVTAPNPTTPATQVPGRFNTLPTRRLRTDTPPPPIPTLPAPQR